VLSCCVLRAAVRETTLRSDEVEQQRQQQLQHLLVGSRWRAESTSDVRSRSAGVNETSLKQLSSTPSASAAAAANGRYHTSAPHSLTPLSLEPHLSLHVAATAALSRNRSTPAALRISADPATRVTCSSPLMHRVQQRRQCIPSFSCQKLSRLTSVYGELSHDYTLHLKLLRHFTLL